VLSRDTPAIPRREFRLSNRIVPFPSSFLDSLNEFYEKPACNKEHDRDADKQDVHELPSFAWINISISGIKLLLKPWE
jgi:hypothetical protein